MEALDSGGGVWEWGWRERAASGYFRSRYCQNPSKTFPGESAANVHNAGFMPPAVELSYRHLGFRGFNKTLLFSLPPTTPPTFFILFLLLYELRLWLIEFKGIGAADVDTVVVASS